ncbi:hypothetical protein [Trichocoleus sp. DQ-U1]|uniref:TRADD-N-associated membrane domain-containing protein n=1 Tax=Trichocoleus sp. DQ-U1 TaxID=2933926 RepID=UPI003298EDA4
MNQKNKTGNPQPPVSLAQMNNRFQVNAEAQTQNIVVSAFDTSPTLAPDTYLVAKAVAGSSGISPAVSPNDISIWWYQERSRQASVSFNLAVGLAGVTGILSLAFAASVCTGNVSVATAMGAIGLTSGVAGTCLFKFSDDANKRLDETARRLLDDE